MFSRLLYLFGGLAGCILNLLMVALIFYSPDLRKPPTDLILIISSCSFLESLHLLIGGFQLLVNGMAPISGTATCSVDGIISLIGSNGMFIYGVGFALAPTIIVNNTLKDKWKRFMILFYLIGTIVIVTVIILATATDSIKTSVIGGCFYEGTGVIYQSITWGLLFVYVALIVYSILKFRRVVPKNEKTRKKRGRYLTFFKAYFATTLSVNAVEQIFQALVTWSCTNHPNDSSVLLTIYIFTIQLPPIIRPILFALEPRITARIHHFSKFRERYHSMMDDDSQQSENDYLAELTNTVRISTVYSLLSGVLLMDNQLTNDSLDYSTVDDIMSDSSEFNLERPGFLDTSTALASFFQTQQFSPEDCDQVGTIHMNDEEVVKLVDPIQGLQAFDMQVSLLAPKVFSALQKQDSSFLNIRESLDLLRNQELIQRFNEGPDGGKSGEFFFFSWDNRLVLKTIGVGELKAIKQRLMQFGNYMVSKSDSFITRIYGVYIFKRLNQRRIRENTTNVLLMQNASFGVPREFVTRVYDLKGSEYDRQVLKSPDMNPTKYTLKDTDFFLLEGSINIEQRDCLVIRDILQRDTNFFKNIHLIDYSLLIMKVNWKLYGVQEGVNIEDIKSRLPNNLSCMKSTFEDGIYYHIAIIDYLQEWNVKKGVERATKKFIKMKSDLDTSAQDPKYYAERFQKKLVEKIFMVGS